MNEAIKQIKFLQIYKQAREYNNSAKKSFNAIIKEINTVKDKRDSGRLKKHALTMTAIFENLRNNVISIEISNIRKMEHIPENELGIVMRGAKNILSIIANQNAALAGAIGMTKYIPRK